MAKHNKDTFLYKEGDSKQGLVESILKHKNQIAMFNKQSGEFTGLTTTVSEPYLNDKFYKWKKIEIDTETQKWSGDYDTGGVVNVADAPVEIFERDMDRRAGEAIEAVYAWYQQINTIIPVIQALIEKNNLTGSEVDAFLDTADFIQEKRDTNDRYKKAYQDGPDWELITKDEEQKTKARQFEGGIRELLGPDLGLTPSKFEGPGS